MKNYLIFSTLSYVFISFVIELLMSVNPGFITFAGYSWFISKEFISLSRVTSWVIQGLALSLAAYLYIHLKSPLIDGVRFGLITGLMFILVVLFNMMVHVDHSFYTFFNESLLPLVILQITGFALIGWMFGLMFEVFSPNINSVNKLWSIA